MVVPPATMVTLVVVSLCIVSCFLCIKLFLVIKRVMALRRPAVAQVTTQVPFSTAEMSPAMLGKEVAEAEAGTVEVLVAAMQQVVEAAATPVGPISLTQPM